MLSPNLPEIDAFEGLLRDCSLKCGLEVKNLSEVEQPRKFLTLQAPYTTFPQCYELSEDCAKDNIAKVTMAKRRREKGQEADRRIQERNSRRAEALKKSRKNPSPQKKPWMVSQLIKELGYLK